MYTLTCKYAGKTETSTFTNEWALHTYAKFMERLGATEIYAFGPFGQYGWRH